MNTDEINLIAMIYCEFSAIEMTVFFNYSNEKSIYGRKKKLAKKMNLTNDLNQFIKEYNSVAEPVDSC